MSTQWTDFFSMLAQVSVSLLALLFVSFQITRDRWINKPARQLVAIQTSLEFLTPAFFAFIALLPTDPIFLGNNTIEGWQIGGVMASLLGLFICFSIIRQGRKNSSGLDNFAKLQIKLQWFAILVDYLPILVFSIIGNLLLTSIVLIWILFSGSVETWMFFSEHD